MNDADPWADLPPEVAMQERPADSPSGKYRLEVLPTEMDGAAAQAFRILDEDGEVVFESPESYLDRALTFFLWGPDDRVWVYSGDRGTFFYTQAEDSSTWERSVYAESDVPAPAFLKQVRPRWHQR